MIVAVLDTNDLGSAFPAPGGVPAALVDAWRREEFDLVVSDHILTELAETWRDPYWRSRFSTAESEAAIALLNRVARVTPLTVQITGIATHPEDDRVLASAISGRALYLVTGDRRLRAVGAFQGVTIFSPREFLDRLARAERE